MTSILLNTSIDFNICSIIKGMKYQTNLKDTILTTLMFKLYHKFGFVLSFLSNIEKNRKKIPDIVFLFESECN